MNSVVTGACRPEKRQQERRVIERRRDSGSLAEILNNINLLIHLTADPHKILARVLAEAAHALGAESAVIFILKEGQWEAAYIYNLPAELAGKYYLNEEVTHAALALEIAAPLVVHDTAKDDRVNHDFTDKLGIRSLLACPLIARGEPMGGIAFHWHSTAVALDAEHINFALRLANSISLDLDNAGHFAELELYDREYEILNNMNILFQGADTPREYYRIIAESARQLFPSDRGIIYTIDESKTILETIAVWGEKKIADAILKPRECWALKLGKIYSTDNAMNKSLCSHPGHARHATQICVPMMDRNENIGLFHLEFDNINCPLSKQRRSAEHRKHLAEIAAKHITSALVNLKLREEHQRQSVDSATDLCNRRYMMDNFERELHRMSRKKGPLGVIMLDIDHLAQLSDAQGHEAKDALLGKLEIFFRRRVRAEDLACRRGEGFLVVMPEATLDKSRQRAEQFREEVKHFSPSYSGRVISHITISSGVAAFPDDGKTREELFRAAEAALHRAKSEGRDRVITTGAKPGKVFKTRS